MKWISNVRYYREDSRYVRLPGWPHRFPAFRPIYTFRDLQEAVAEIGYNNPELEILFRGQHSEHLNQRGEPQLLPSIYRNLTGTLEDQQMKFDERCRRLGELGDILVEDMVRAKAPGVAALRQHLIARWAWLQHYRLVRTPLLDLTRSTRVAASFALNDNPQADQSRPPVVYVVGLPYLDRHVTVDYDQNMMIANLRNLVPWTATRPHEQEGYLVGDAYDWKATDPGGNELFRLQHSGAPRLLARLRIASCEQKFWTNDYHAIPNAVLVPRVDPMKTWLADYILKNNLQVDTPDQAYSKA